MSKGIIFALGACFVWGLTFVIPQFMATFSPIEVALGRYLVYGIVSCIFFLQLRLKKACIYSRSIWAKALVFSLVSTIGNYTFIVLAVRYSSPTICALIMGLAPITIAYYGNWRQKEVLFKNLITPSIFLFLGLMIINISHLEAVVSIFRYALGWVFGFLALSIWTWYSVTNARFLKRYSEVSTSDWSTLMGVCSLFWVALFACILHVFFEDQLQIEKYGIINYELISFFVSSVILGLFSTWIGNFLWNTASFYLPISLAGQLTVLETIFGILFFYILKQSVPSAFEIMGIITLLVGVFYAIKQFTEEKPQIDSIDTLD